MTSLRPDEAPFGRLDESRLPPDPLALFREWYEHAGASPDVRYPDAMVLATVDASGQPDGRVVLLKGLEEGAFVFFTNTRSAKGQALAAHPRAALVFYWDGVGRQVRIRGWVESVDDDAADAYFASRPRESRIGAWASEQSERISGRDELERRVARVRDRYAEREVPRPPHWSGYRVVPREIEFWQEGENRLHDRFLYRRTDEGWGRERLSP